MANNTLRTKAIFSIEWTIFTSPVHKNKKEVSSLPSRRKFIVNTNTVYLRAHGVVLFDHKFIIASSRLRVSSAVPGAILTVVFHVIVGEISSDIQRLNVVIQVDFFNHTEIFTQEYGIVGS